MTNSRDFEHISGAAIVENDKCPKCDSLRTESGTTQWTCGTTQDLNNVLRRTETCHVRELAKSQSEDEWLRARIQKCPKGHEYLANSPEYPCVVCGYGEAEQLRKELKVTDQLLADRQRILDLFECPVHGECVPFAIEEIGRLRQYAEMSKMRLATIEEQRKDLIIALFSLYFDDDDIYLDSLDLLIKDVNNLLEEEGHDGDYPLINRFDLIDLTSKLRRKVKTLS